MISFSKSQQIIADLAQNATPENLTRAAYLGNMEHRYLMQKFFGNEGSYQINTIGNTEVTLSAVVSTGATSATLDTAWGYQSTQVPLTFSDGESVLANVTNGSTSITWQPPLAGVAYGLTAALAIGATTATLSTAWAGTSGSYVSSFSDGETKTVTYTNGSTSVTWTGGLTSAQLATVNVSTIPASSVATIGGVQFYPFPPNYSKLKDITITVGVLRWTLEEVRTREEWDSLNVFPYYASIPSKFFIYPGGDKSGKIGIWPIPSTSGNVITFNYKFRVPDLSLPDYGAFTYSGLIGNLVIGDVLTVGSATGVIDNYTSTNVSLGNISGTFGAGAFTTGNGASGTVSVVATVAATNGSTAVTGTGTSFTVTTNQQLESRWIKFAQPQGDGLWYQIQNVNSTTGITLYQPYQGITFTGSAGFTIGQMPLIAEDFQDMIPWRVLSQYYMSIVDNPKQAEEYQSLYEQKLKLLQEYSGSNTINVNLSRKGRKRNPNVYPQTVGGAP